MLRKNLLAQGCFMDTRTESKLGRPRKRLTSDAVKSTVTFLNDQIVWLDRLSNDIRSNTKEIVDRGALIRAFITALKESKLDLSHVKSEQEACNAILEKLIVRVNNDKKETEL